MILYGVIILVAMITVSVLNIFFNPMGLPWYHFVIATVIFTLSLFILDAIIAIVTRKMPEKHFDCNKKFFTASKRELAIYQKLGVKKWKDHIPELGGFTSFHKNHIADPKNNEYISRFLLEASYGVMIHFLSIFIPFIIAFIDWRMFIGQSNLWLTIAIPCAAVNALLNFMPVCVLKFNIPKLKAVYKLNARKKQID